VTRRGDELHRVHSEHQFGEVYICVVCLLACGVCTDVVKYLCMYVGYTKWLH
jgi:hypothetical protein